MRALFVAVVACVLLGLTAVADHVPYRYTINLDEPAEKRYYPVVFDMCRDEVHSKAFKKLLVALEATLIDQLGAAVGGKDRLFAAADSVFATRLPEVSKELKGMSQYFKKYCDLDLPSGELATMQLIYQIAMPFIVENEKDSSSSSADVNAMYKQIIANFGMACTSIVVANSTGHVIHGRNLDWINSEMYEPLTTELTFTRGGEVVAVTGSFFPELAPTTLVSPVFGFSYNARVAELQYDASCIMTPGHPMDPFTLVIRQKAFDGVSYAELFEQLRTATFCAPAYIVISGPGENEGALFTTHINKAPEVRTIGQTYDDPDDTRESWFVVVANDDTEYSNACNWSQRYNFTLGLLSNLDQDYLASSIDLIDAEILNVSGVRRDDATCYMGVMDTLDMKYKFVVRSNITDDEFYQNSTIPSEPEDPSTSTSTSTSDVSGSSMLSVSVVMVLLAAFTAILAF